jgi:hypothetical protein
VESNRYSSEGNFRYEVTMARTVIMQEKEQILEIKQNRKANKKQATMEISKNSNLATSQHGTVI